MELPSTLPRQSLRDLVNWGNSFLALPDSEKELTRLYGRSPYLGSIKIAQWWQTLSESQSTGLEQVDFPYWTLDLAKKVAQVPLHLLDTCLEALQKAQLSISISKMSRILNKFVVREKSPPRQKRYSQAEVESALQSKEQELLAASEQIRQLEQENERLQKELRSHSESETTVDITPIVEKSPADTPPCQLTEQPDVFDECLSLWLPQFEIGDRVRVIDKGDLDYYGCVGKVTGQDTTDRAHWWVEFQQGNYKQFPATALERISQESESASIPRKERVMHSSKEVEPVPLAG